MFVSIFDSLKWLNQSIKKYMIIFTRKNNYLYEKILSAASNKKKICKKEIQSNVYYFLPPFLQSGHFVMCI